MIGLAVATLGGVVAGGDSRSPGVPATALDPTGCDAPLGMNAIDEAPGFIDADILETLDELYLEYAGLPGFIDVYYHADKSPSYRPMFVGDVPPGATEWTPRVEVAFDVIPQAPQPVGPGLLPSTTDIGCGGVRPGMRITSAVGICTANFIFTAGANVYIGTAGHCINAGQTAFWSGGTLGTAVFSTGNAGVGNDFALIQLTAANAAIANPEMCDWAGPTGVFNGAGITGRRVYQTGHGAGLINVAPRPKVGVGFAIGATSFTYIGSSVPGDSGSPARVDAVGTEPGEGLGVVTHISILPVPVVLNFGTRLSHAMTLPGIGGLALSAVTYTHGG